MNLKSRIPVLLIEKQKITRKSGRWIFGKESINPSEFGIIILGQGCEYDHLIFKDLALSKTLCVLNPQNSISMYTCIGKRSGKSLFSQISTISNERRRLACAKKMVKLRNSKKSNHIKSLSVSDAKTVGEVLLKEAIWSKYAYNRLARLHGQVWIGKELINKSHNLMIKRNRLLYLLAYAAICHLGLDPNNGIIHNNRGLGLVFDIADIFKSKYSWEPYFKNSSCAVNEKVVIKEMIKVLEVLF